MSPAWFPFTQILRKAAKKAEEEASLKRSVAAASANAASVTSSTTSTGPRVGGGAGSARKKRRWDDNTPVAGAIGDTDETPAVSSGKAGVSDWDADVATPVRRSFGGSETPGRSRWDQTPSRDAQVKGDWGP